MPPPIAPGTGQIARILHRKRLKTSKGLPFNAQRVTNIRSRYDIAGHTRANLGGEPNVYTVEQAAQLLRVSRRTLDNWIATGLLRARQLMQGAPWQVQVSEADRRRLGATDAPQGWLTLKSAASALGVSQQTVLNKLIRKVYEADPLQCPKCKGPMRVIALIDDPGVIRHMLEGLTPGRYERFCIRDFSGLGVSSTMRS